MANILNRVSSKIVSCTPYEIWRAKKSNHKYLKIWRCPANVLNRRKTGKLDSRTEVCLFIGYPNSTRGGIFYNPRYKKVFISTHATFLKNEYMNDYKPRSKLLLEKVSGKLSSNVSTRVIENDTDSVTTRVVDMDIETENNTNEQCQKVIIPRRSARISRPLEYYQANIVVPDTNDEDPSSYEEAIKILIVKIA